MKNIFDLLKRIDSGKVNLCKKESLLHKIARIIIKFKYSRPNKNYNLLNLGCGSKWSSEFINADVVINKKLLIKKYKNYWYLNAASRWECKNEIFEGIFTEHMLEHLAYSDAILALEECYRTLKKNAILRIIIPSLDKYNFDASVFLKDKFGYKALAISNLTQNAGHISVWDYSLLQDVLKSIGFQKVELLGFGEGRDKKIILDSPEREWASIYVEAMK